MTRVGSKAGKATKSRFRPWLIGAACAGGLGLLVAGVIGTDGGRPDLRQPGLQEVRCWNDTDYSGQIVTCFYMVVRENPDDALSPLVAFPVVKISNWDRSSDKNPVLDLGGGGPGGSAGLERTFNGAQTHYAHLAAPTGRDYYVIDPRGVGMAQPGLTCIDLFDPIRAVLARAATEREEWETWQDVYQECKDRIDAAGHDLSHYNSRVVARDVELLRRALKVEKWALFGYSYAARYALTIARDFPQSVEAMTLFSPVFPDTHDFDLSPGITHAAFQKAFGRCGDAGTCDPASLEERFQHLTDRLNAAPMIVHDIPEGIVDVFGNDYGLERIVLTGSRLVKTAFITFYDADLLAIFPHLVRDLERRQSNVLMEVLPMYMWYYLTPDYSDPVAYAHHCSERHPFADFEELMRGIQESPLYIRDLYESYTEEDFRSECRLWGVAAADPVEAEAVVTSIPTLFMQGELDPVAPIDHLIDQLPNFDNHAVLVFENSSHWGSVGGSCAMRVAAYFFDHKRRDDARAGCADSRNTVHR